MINEVRYAIYVNTGDSSQLKFNTCIFMKFCVPYFVCEVFFFIFARKSRLKYYFLIFGKMKKII